MAVCGHHIGSWLLVLGVGVVCSSGAPIQGSTQAMMYLSHFGYLDPAVQNPSSNAALMSGEAYKRAILEFQAFAGLNQTGILDKETKEMMNLPRCGVKDVIGHGAGARRKRYALQGSRWRVKDLTYRISKYPSRLKKGVDDTIQKGFNLWADYTDLTFTQKTSGKTHIEIRFETGEHGDGDAFDGPGGTLAHAYFPVYGGDAHFDNEEDWTVESYKGTSLLLASAHEFGHSLGLSHSDVKDALMAPFYKEYNHNFKLHKDDVTGIQALYGKKTKPTVRPPPKPTSTTPVTEWSSDPKLCADASIDAIVTANDDDTYVFKDTQYWKLSDDGMAAGYPRPISSGWEGLPSYLDAAFSYTDDEIYFFKGSKYWRFVDMKLDNRFPMDISVGFEGIPDDIDAAFIWSGNGKIYFFKGDKYWRFDGSSPYPVKNSYPKSISHWYGIPDDVDDALQYSNGYTYFFKKGQYWRFNDRLFEVDEAEPSFPRSAAYWWFGCKGDSTATNGDFPNDRGDITPNSDYEADINDDAGEHQAEDSEDKFDARREEAEKEKDSAAGASTAAITPKWSPLPLVFGIVLVVLSFWEADKGV